MALKHVSGPAVEPVTLDEMKLYLKQDEDADDALINDCIVEARTQSENATERSWVLTTWDFACDAFPSHGAPFEVPRPPLLSVVSLKYIDTSGVEQTLTEGDDYVVDTFKEPGLVSPAFGTLWPSSRRQSSAVVLRFTAGYGVDATFIPRDLVRLVRMIVADAYELREAKVIGTIVAENNAVKRIIWRNKFLRAVE